MVGTNSWNFDRGRDEALAAFAAEPPNLTFRHTLLIGDKKYTGFLGVGLGGSLSRFQRLFCWLLFGFGLCSSSGGFLRYHTPEDPPVALMTSNSHPGCRRALEFPIVLQTIS